MDVFTLTNARGTEVRFTGYGGIVLSIRVPDRNGEFDDVTLGFNSLRDYITENRYFGALIGRYANRIAGGRFNLDGREYTLERNEGPNHLHGGGHGFDKVIWDVEPFHDQRGVGAVFSYTSVANEGGYPGTVVSRVTYTLTDADRLVFDYHAITDESTPINLTHHSCFNLAGREAPNILDHELMLPASRFLPVDSTLIPTGDVWSVSGTPFDFTTPTQIGDRIDDPDGQLRCAGGYDHGWVLDRRASAGLSLAARLHEPKSGRTVEVHTTEPGIQFYSGNMLNGHLVGKQGRVYGHHHG